MTNITLQKIGVLIIVAAAIVIPIVRRYRRRRRGIRSHCSCGCSGCPLERQCTKSKDSNPHR